MIIVDLDDFCDDETSLDAYVMLRQIHRAIPKFKATLFTIPGRCDREFIRYIRRTCYTWLQLVPHGWMHETNHECEKWTKAETHIYLRQAREQGITTRGFKAPGWQISDGCYQALLEEEYWVADQPYNNARRPPFLRAYLLDERDTKIHGHIGHLGGHNVNALEFIMPQILEAGKTDTDFRFIDEVM